MKIGIITFHWATNYGAILQAYCLQEHLSAKGHDVEIINYKPKRYDFSWKKYLQNPLLLRNIRKDSFQNKKEKLLISFRNQYLHQTKRYFRVSDIVDDAKDYDILISGSDQVLNPWFTMNGEDGHSSAAYYLLFGQKRTIKLGYSISFGHTTYPNNAIPLATDWIKNFNAIGYRENTGKDILNQLSYKGGAELTPDPTILLGQKLFEMLNIKIPKEKDDFICVYMLRREVFVPGLVKYIDDKHQPLSMKEWLLAISHAKYLITNSYHGMIMAILSRVPFAVLAENGSGSGMNDRFNTLLDQLNLKNRMVGTVNEALKISSLSIDFACVEEKMEQYREKGASFINKYIKN